MDEQTQTLFNSILAGIKDIRNRIEQDESLGPALEIRIRQLDDIIYALLDDMDDEEYLEFCREQAKYRASREGT